MLKSIHLVQKYSLPAEVTWKLFRITCFCYNCSSSTHTFGFMQRLAVPLKLFTVFWNSAGLLRASLRPPKFSRGEGEGKRKRQADHQYISFPYFSPIAFKSDFSKTYSLIVLLSREKLTHTHTLYSHIGKLRLIINESSLWPSVITFAPAPRTVREVCIPTESIT